MDTDWLKNWLKKKLTIEEVEMANTVQDRRLGPVPIPFGFQNAQWKALLAQMMEGDELWEFSTSPESWRALAGSAGIALVRDGQVIVSILTKMS